MQARQSGERRRVLVFAQERDVLRYLRAAGPSGGPYAAGVPTPEAVACDRPMLGARETPDTSASWSSSAAPRGWPYTRPRTPKSTSVSAGQCEVAETRAASVCPASNEREHPRNA